MADIYFKRVKSLAGDYLSLVGVKNVKPEERSSLSIVLGEYRVVCGDIAEGSKARGEKLILLLKEMRADGHTLHGL